MTRKTDQEKIIQPEEGVTVPERAEQGPTQAEQAVNAQKRAEAHDARELSRATTAGKLGKAQETIRIMQAHEIVRRKSPEGTQVDTLTRVVGALRKALGTAGMVAAMSGAFELSKFTNFSAQAATLDQSPTAVESIDQKNSKKLQAFKDYREGMQEQFQAGYDIKKSLVFLVDFAKRRPDVFVTLLEQSYQSVDQERYGTQDGRTIATDWTLSHADMVRAIEDSSFSKNNTEELIQTMLDRGHDVKLGFTEKDGVVLREYSSQAYSEKPRAENNHIIRRDVIFNTTMSGNEYGVRGVISYDEKGIPYKLFVEAQKKNTHAFESDTINNESDERIALLASEFQNEFSRYQHGEMGARTFGEYAKPGRELVEHIRVMTELEKRGLTDEALVAARQIAQDVHRIESGSMVGKEAVEGKGFFDYRKFPERVQHELAKEQSSLARLEEVVHTRGGVVLNQLGRDIPAKAREMMSGTEEK